jgi:hypothetical protein
MSASNASAIGLPVSALMIAATSLARWYNRRSTVFKSRLRMDSEVVRQVAPALRARFTAEQTASGSAQS